MTNSPVKPSYVFKEEIISKLDKIAQKKYGKKCYKSLLAKDANLDRATVSKMFDPEPKGCDFESLFAVSKSLGHALSSKDDCIQIQSVAKAKGKKQVEDPIKEMLKTALFNLNYRDQERLFDDFINSEYMQGNSQIGTFLIHGKQDHGQQWLLNRLVRLVPYYSKAYKKSHNITRRKDIQSVWKDLGETFETESKPHIIAQQIYKQWETQPIILAIRGIELIKGDCLNELLRQFWWELVEIGQNKPASTLPLLLFLVDNQGCNCQLGIELLTEMELNKPQYPLDLRPIQGFTNSDLISWCRSQLSAILQELNNHSVIEIEQKIAEIVSRNTNPIFALEAISTSCNLNWYTHIEGKFTL